MIFVMMILCCITCAVTVGLGVSIHRLTRRVEALEKMHILEDEV